MRWVYLTRPGTIVSFLARLMPPLTGFVIVVTTGGGWPS
jgi:hypothetical protein